MCDFCDGKDIYSSRYANIKIDMNVPFYGECLTVFGTENRCPKYSNCSAKNIKTETHFKINYCPMCGKKLNN